MWRISQWVWHVPSRKILSWCCGNFSLPLWRCLAWGWDRGREEGLFHNSYHNIKHLSQEHLKTFYKYWWSLPRPWQFSEIICLYCGKLLCCLEELSNCTRPSRRNKALSKCRLLQKNCKKILWHKDGAGRKEADFSWERCLAFPPPDVSSCCLLPACHQGHAAPLAGQNQSMGLRPPFLLFKRFLSQCLVQAPILLSPCQQQWQKTRLPCLLF